MQEPAIVFGVIRGFSVSERSLLVKFEVSDGRRLRLRIDSTRLDLIAQLEVVRYALAANEDQAIREANGFEPLEPKVVWAMLEGPPRANVGALAHPDAPSTYQAAALGIGIGRSNPFDYTAEGF